MSARRRPRNRKRTNKAPLGLHSEPVRFPYADVARRLGDRRDRFAQVVLRFGRFYEFDKEHPLIGSMIASADNPA